MGQVWINVPDFGALVNGWIDAVQNVFNGAGDFGDIKYNVVSSKSAMGSSLYTVNIALNDIDTQVVQIVCDNDVFHTFYHRHQNLDDHTAAFISQFLSAMQSQWALDPSKVAVQ